MKNEHHKDLAVKDFDQVRGLNFSSITVKKDSEADQNLYEKFVAEEEVDVSCEGYPTVRVRLIGMERGKDEVIYRSEKVTSCSD